jgi:hypothetical protein
MKTLFKSKIIFVFALVVTGLLFSCKNNEQDGYSDKIETLQATDTAKTGSDTTEVSGLSTTNKSTKGSSGTDKGGTGTGSGPGESPKDGATDSGPSEDSAK